MISGVTVNVLRPSTSGTDRLGNATHGTPTKEAVANVLVAPGDTESFEASRPDGTSAMLTLHFPKSYAASLRGCEVELPTPWGGTWRVVGDPMPYIDGNTPTPWNRPVSVEVAHG